MESYVQTASDTQYSALHQYLIIMKGSHDMKNKKSLILILASLGAISSLILVYKEISLSNYCPKVFNIPACYLVLLSFILVLESVIYNHKLFFWTGSSLGVLLAVWFSYNQLIGNPICPIFLNIPLCYVSLLTFIAIIIFYKQS